MRHWGMGANHAPGGGRAPARHLFALPPCCLVGGRGGFGRPPAPAFSFLFRPHPPSPLPLRGRGRFLVYFAGGFAPGTPAFNRLRHLQNLPSKYPAGVCLLSHLPTLPLVSYFAPIPPAPFPSGEGGDFRLFHARGFAPCIPATEPVRHWGMGANHAPGGGRAPARHLFALPPCCLVGGRGGFGRPPAPAFSFLFRPHPPSPLPLRGRGRFLVYFAGGFAPGTPAFNRLRHLQSLPIQYPATETQQNPRRKPLPVVFAANHGFNPGDARGEAPCIRKL